MFGFAIVSLTRLNRLIATLNDLKIEVARLRRKIEELEDRL